MRARVVGSLLCAVAMGCTGIISEGDAPAGDAYDSASESGEAVDIDGDGIPDEGATRSGNGAAGGDGASGDGAGGDGSQISVDGDASDFTYATLGARCSNGARESFVVVSRAAASCEDHARALDEPSTDDVLRIAIGDDDEFDGSVSLCTAGSCRDVPVHLALEGRDDDAGGSLELELDGAAVTRGLKLTACDYDAAVPPPREAYAANVSIRELALYQGVKVRLGTGGGVIDTGRNAPVVAGRPALFRAFVDPLAGFSARTLVGRLELTKSNGEPQVFETKLDVSSASSDAELGSTFNFDVPGELITPNTQYAMGVYEAESCGGALGENRVPSGGTEALGAELAGNAFQVVVVPVRYNADGSGRTPNLDLERLRDTLFGMFPVASVDISLREPMDFNIPIQANGSGWSELLDQCLAERNSDNVADGIYYYCMFNPAPDFAQYCRGGCVAGLGPVPSANDVFRRGSIGLGFGDPGGTMAHELGHSLGRPHAPCGGPASPDPGYPYSGGRIGSWGYDLVSKRLLDPSASTDVMGYCGNQWISDYNFDLLFDRMRAVYTSPRLIRAPRDLWSIVIDADGSLKLGHELSMSEVPDGELVRVRFFDAANAELLSAEGWYVAVTHVSGGIVYVPAPPPGTVRVDIEGFGALTL